MKVMAMKAHGGPEVLQVMDLPEPVPGDHDLLVEVKATAINPVDYKIRRGGSRYTRPMPFTLGFDVSGVVLAIGRQVQYFKPGDEIYASPSLARHGAYGPRVLVDYRTAARKPARLDHVEAAAMPLVTLTAWESLHKRAAIHRDETVLIHAGAGGVGHIAVQLARIHGCRVITTASRPETVDLCRRFGADLVINYRQEDFVARVKQETGNQGLPVVFDTVGGEVFDKSLECVAVNGRMVTIVANESKVITQNLFGKNAALHYEFMGVPTMYGLHPETQGETLRTVAELVDAGKLSPHVGKVIALEQIPDAHREQEAGHVIGKTVVRL